VGDALGEVSTHYIFQGGVPATRPKTCSQLRRRILLLILVATITPPAQAHASFDVITTRAMERHNLLECCASGDKASVGHHEAAGFQEWPHSCAGALFSRETF
jgi:hypothetical protein